jgi:hypothetical protein
MEAEIKSIGLKKFIEQMKKYDSIMGESDRMKFLDEKYKEYQKIFMEDEDHH